MKFVLTIWLCLTAHPDCPIEQSTMSPVAQDMDDQVMCNAVASVVEAHLPPPKGRVVRHSCTPKDED